MKNATTAAMIIMKIRSFLLIRAKREKEAIVIRPLIATLTKRVWGVKNFDRIQIAKPISRPVAYRSTADPTATSPINMYVNNFGKEKTRPLLTPLLRKDINGSRRP